MREDIHQYFAIRTTEIEVCVDLIIGMFEERKTSSTALAGRIRGDAKLASKQQRVERFYENLPVEPQWLLDAIIAM